MQPTSFFGKEIYIIMDEFYGKYLAYTIQQSGALPENLIAQYAKEVIFGLQYLNSQDCPQKSSSFKCSYFKRYC
jgi:serine/threonine protein kinase